MVDNDGTILCDNCGHECHCVPTDPYDNCPDGSCNYCECVNCEHDN